MWIKLFLALVLPGRGEDHISLLVYTVHCQYVVFEDGVLWQWGPTFSAGMPQINPASSLSATLILLPLPNLLLCFLPPALSLCLNYCSASCSQLYL